MPLVARRKAGGPVRWTWCGPSHVLWLPGTRQDGSVPWRVGGKPSPSGTKLLWALRVACLQEDGGSAAHVPNRLPDNHPFTQSFWGEACSLLGPSSCLLGPGFCASAATASLPPGKSRYLPEVCGSPQHSPPARPQLMLLWDPGPLLERACTVQETGPRKSGSLLQGKDQIPVLSCPSLGSAKLEDHTVCRTGFRPRILLWGAL